VAQDDRLHQLDCMDVALDWALQTKQPVKDLDCLQAFDLPKVFYKEPYYSFGLERDLSYLLII